MHSAHNFDLNSQQFFRVINTPMEQYTDTTSIDSGDAVNTDNTLLIVPTPTTNYYVSKFNKNDRTRDILFDGAVPLHEIVHHFYDLFFNYINFSSANTVLYLAAILKPEPPHRPETPIIFKIEGSNNKKERLERVAPVIDLVVNQFDAIFDIFINDTDGDLRTKTKYRTDTHKKVLINSYLAFNQTIKPKLFALLLQ